jgi:hypothetical protein
MMTFMMLLFVHLKNDLSVSHRVFVLMSDLSGNLDIVTYCLLTPVVTCSSIATNNCGFRI